MPVTAEQAQTIIDSLPPYVPPTALQREVFASMRVNYQSVPEMPRYKLNRLDQSIEWITNKFGNVQIFLCMSQLDGCPVDEFTTQEQFEAKKSHGKAKFSDWDFVVPEADANIIEQIAPMVKVDIFKVHHNGVRLLEVKP